jgi:hypothetical protein
VRHAAAVLADRGSPSRSITTTRSNRSDSTRAASKPAMLAPRTTTWLLLVSRIR